MFSQKGGSVVKNPPANAGDSGSVPGLGRSPGEQNNNPLQFLPRKFARIEESGGLQFLGSQRVEGDSATKHSTEVVTKHIL
jgi:hypothetical protein